MQRPRNKFGCVKKNKYHKFYLFLVFNKERRKYNDLMRKLRAGVAVLDMEYNIIAIQTNLNDSWVCQYYFGLVLGVISLFISLAWVAHMYYLLIT